MKGYTVYLKSLNLRLFDIQQTVTQVIEPQLSEDNFKYNLEKNNRLLRKFIVYRITSFIFSSIESHSSKIILVLPPSLSLTLYKNNEQFIINTFRKISDLLSLNLVKDILFVDCLKYVESTKGESRELRNRLQGVVFNNKKAINFSRINKFLEKNGIHKLQGELNNNFKVKLGLFVT